MTLKSRMRAAAKRQTQPSGSQNATVNRAGGVAFEIQDPATKLVTMTGGAFFAEPRYYEGDLAAKRVTAAKDAAAKERFSKLEQRVKLNEGHLQKADVDEVTKEILRTAEAIAEGPNPEDLLIIARWLRHEMNIRVTPQALLVVASRFEGTKPFVRRYAPVIAVRPDEIKTCLLMHRFFFGMKTLKNCLAQGLSDAVSKFGEKALLKYDGAGWPTWKDVLQVLPRGKGRPLAPELAGYFLKGEVLDAQATPVIAARKELAKLRVFNAEARDLAVKSMVNWEVLLSQFGDDKKAVWEFLLQEDLVGYMALLRNLRNILQAGVGQKAVSAVSRKVADRDEVLRSKQLPFRFLSAYASLQSAGRVSDEADMSELLAAVALASNVAAENIRIPGVTAIFADGSGSMTTTNVSDKSTVSCAQAAGVMAGIAAKSGDRAYLFEFATDVREVRFSKTDTVLDIAAKVATGNGVNGHGTEAWKIPGVLLAKGLTPDRVIVLSDMQCWGSACWGSGSLCDTWAKYKKSSAQAKDTWMHCVHLNGYGDSPVDEGGRVNQVGAFSEKVFDMLLQAEGVLGDEAVPTVEQIRQKYKL
jgi:60 kDa SS-A/Ro ribonucleoprotein